MDWLQTELWERMRWARQQARFERPVDAARSLNIKPVTYRTYEVAKADGGREPPTSEITRIADKFKVDWIWLLSGRGDPKPPPTTDPRIDEINKRVVNLDQARKDAALDAALSVVVSLTQKTRA